MQRRVRRDVPKKAVHAAGDRERQERQRGDDSRTPDCGHLAFHRPDISEPPQRLPPRVLDAHASGDEIACEHFEVEFDLVVDVAQDITFSTAFTTSRQAERSWPRARRPARVRR